MQPAAVEHPGLSEPRSLVRSFAFCDRLARREAGNFYHAFRILPRPQRSGMCALYAFLRVADDLADSDDSSESRRAALIDWRRQLAAALRGSYHHPLHPALHHTVRRFDIPADHLEAVLDGVVMDLDPVAYETFAKLYPYCYRVASAVGLACVRLWGCADKAADAPAEAAGIAFQLTNILRDLGEDAARGRIYLPREDLDRFGYSAADLQLGRRDDRFQRLMQFQAARAHAYYEAGAPLAALLPPPGRAVFLTMLRTYRGLLDAIVRKDFDVFTDRVQLSRLHKLFLVARALPVRWGWA